jgi:hypothetical protein
MALLLRAFAVKGNSNRVTLSAAALKHPLLHNVALWVSISLGGFAPSGLACYGQ